MSVTIPTENAAEYSKTLAVHLNAVVGELRRLFLVDNMVICGFKQKYVGGFSDLLCRFLFIILRIFSRYLFQLILISVDFHILASKKRLSVLS